MTNLKDCDPLAIMFAGTPNGYRMGNFCSEEIFYKFIKFLKQNEIILEINKHEFVSVAENFAISFIIMPQDSKYYFVTYSERKNDNYYSTNYIERIQNENIKQFCYNMLDINPIILTNHLTRFIKDNLNYIDIIKDYAKDKNNIDTLKRIEQVEKEIRFRSI